MKHTKSLSKWTKLILILVLFLLVALGIAAYWQQQQIQSVDTFEDCVAAGYPVMESLPEQCRTPDGRVFINAR